MTPEKKKEARDKAIVKLRTLLPPEWKVEARENEDLTVGTYACDIHVSFIFGDRNRGTAEICTVHRQWAPGIRGHAQSNWNDTWFEVPLTGYKGRGWIDQIARDIRIAWSRLVIADTKDLYGGRPLYRVDEVPEWCWIESGIPRP